MNGMNGINGMNGMNGKNRMNRLNHPLLFITITISLAFAALALIPRESLAHFFSHPVLCTLKGVDIRPVTREGAAWFGIMCWISAAAWMIIPLIAVRSSKTSHGDSTHPTPSMPASTANTTFSNRLQFALICVGFVGLIERLTRIGESFWFDEISALIDYAQYGPGAIMGTYFVQSNHVLHTLLSWCAIFIVGSVSEPVLRAPALLAGIAAIGAVVALVREVAIRQAVPIRPRMAVAYALATLSPIMVLESVEARGYSMMILFAALASWLLLLALRTMRAHLWIAYSMVCALGIWSHLVFVALPASHAIIAAWLMIRPRAQSNDRAGGRLALAALVLGAITTITLLAPLLPDLVRIRREFQALDGNEPSIISNEGFHLLLSIGGAWTTIAAIPTAALMLIGLCGAWNDQRRRLPLVVTLLGLPLLVIATELGGSWMYARFALFALPGILVAMTLGCFDLAAWMRVTGWNPRRAHGTLIAGAILIAALWTLSLSILPSKQPIRDAIVLVRERDANATTIASAGLADNVVAYYGLAVNMEVQDAGLAGAHIDAIDPQVLWLIVLYPNSLGESAKDQLARNWNLVETLPGWVDWNNGAVLVYRRNEIVR